ncbi:hypothetical protein KYK30_14295 [Shinella yambaruensis]|uniref:HTH merR-type domain-containing protein n=1 Tax=Shinella yambaruensis TaxID=415996 RepID=A0ABQ5ZDW1_9HYPH|nr:hypothetical protein [Shinella yambaruensis]MCJ8024426.1 hypothetical protein [Shinella yambaruensis]MCU7980868.1 hypothetical protein [Shinella yambaruensis]GLR49726.1 hypothetical protein GCM10007923_09310 [Shinella yambaruensis]
MTYNNGDLAGLLGLTEASIRQWLCRAPTFRLGAVRGKARIYNHIEAVTIAIAAELFRHRLGRPHEVLPIARQIATSGVDAIWVYRPQGGPITTATDQPAGTAVHLPLAELRRRLSKQ